MEACVIGPISHAHIRNDDSKRVRRGLICCHSILDALAVAHRHHHLVSSFRRFCDPQTSLQYPLEYVSWRCVPLDEAEFCRR